MSHAKVIPYLYVEIFLWFHITNNLLSFIYKYYFEIKLKIIIEFCKIAIRLNGKWSRKPNIAAPQRFT